MRVSTQRAIWNLGFRPFYLAGAAWAVIAIALWMAQWTGLFQLHGHLVGVAWHMHEMIFGYAFAIVVGFLLTAVKSLDWAAHADRAHACPHILCVAGGTHSISDALVACRHCV